METLWDFLVFRRFVSPAALLVFYYLGAVVMPLVAWFIFAWLRRRFPIFQLGLSEAKSLAQQVIKPSHRLLLMGGFLGGFLFMELMWRMLFEYLIAFLQMREALMILSEMTGIK